MCFKVVCPDCNSFTWKGCGKHIEEALKGVEEKDRCHCVSANCPKCNLAIRAPADKAEAAVDAHIKNDH